MVSDMKNITRAEKVFIIVSFILLGLLALMIIVPMISVVINSFVSAAETARRGQFILWPEDWDFTAYKMLFNSDRIYSGYVNTLFVTFVGTGLSMLMTICTAYPLSKKDLRGRNGILAMIFFTMLFNAGIIPNFLLVKTIGLLDTRWALVLPYLLNTWNMLMMRNFFYAIPDALEEAAFLDGANQLQIIVKADVQGSVEAVRQSLEKLSNDEVRVNVIHGAVGAINESDVMLAEASSAIIVGFNVRPDAVAAAHAESAGVDLRLYSVIYDCINEIEAAMKGMLAPKTREVVLGMAEVRNVIKIKSVGTIAGSYVKSGTVQRGGGVRVIRDGIVIADDRIASLQRFKDAVKEVKEGYECGIGLEKFNDLKEGDMFEVYTIEEYRD